jgi:hypothetical protein
MLKQDFIEEIRLVSPEAAKSMENYIDNGLNGSGVNVDIIHRRDSAPCILSGLFYWSQTKEGDKYWRYISDKMIAREQELELNYGNTEPK